MTRVPALTAAAALWPLCLCRPVSAQQSPDEPETFGEQCTDPNPLVMKEDADFGGRVAGNQMDRSKETAMHFS